MPQMFPMWWLVDMIVFVFLVCVGFFRLSYLLVGSEFDFLDFCNGGIFWSW